MEKEEEDGGSDEEAPQPASAGGVSFFDLAKGDDTQLTFIDDPPLDEPVAGESDDDDDASRSSRGRKLRRRGKKNHRRIVISMVSCKYDVVAQAARGLGWRCSVDDSEEYNLLWNDSYVPFDTIASLNRYQKTNHFPGMSELAKKNLLAKNLNRIAKATGLSVDDILPVLPGPIEVVEDHHLFSALNRAQGDAEA